MTSQKNVWSEIREIISACHARVEESGAERVSVKVKLYNDLKSKGLDEAAEVFMFYDAVAGANMPKEPTTVFNFNNAQIANANFGQQLGTISASLQAVSTRDADSAKFADALHQLTEAVVNTSELKDEQKNEVLDGFSFLSKQAEEPPEKRHPSVLKSALKSLSDLLSMGASVATLWQVLGPGITKFFGL